MVKTATRFRTRKITFKTNIPIYVGSNDFPFEEDFAAPSPSGISGFGASGSGTNGKSSKGENGETVRVETGVDKEEESEHHLQAVISASAAALQRSNASGDATGPSKPLIAHIPTPDATGLVANYADYYTHGAYTDPHSYIRYSDTVEETAGVAYTMDEDDEDFLIDHNIRAHKLAKMAKVNGASQANEAKTPISQPGSPLSSDAAATGLANGTSALLPNDQPVISVKGHYPALNTISGIKAARNTNKLGKEALISASVPVVSEDDFELVMDLFERITDRKVPTLHLDISRIPALEDLEPAFSTYLPSSSLRAAKAIARVIYPHWKERRTRAGGKNVVPQLDYDETNETPYVCFRRREVKVARKTRRTDTQTIERLVRLKSDLTSAQELLNKVLEREKCKREAVLAEKRMFETRVQMRELKRKLGEGRGDEAILIPRREKKRRHDDVRGQQSGTKIIIPHRTGLPPLNPGLLPDPLPPYKDRTANATQRVDKDIQRKREQEIGWEDLTDTAFVPLPLTAQARMWRATERHVLPAPQDGRRPSHLVTFDQAVMPFIQDIGSRYRKRVGRGGRVHLDRMTARRISRGAREELGEDILAHLEERWRYDSDVLLDLPAARKPLVYDDFQAKCGSARLALFTPADWESLQPNTAHVEEALRWSAKDPPPLPPMQIIGKLPGQRISLPNPMPNGTMSNHLQASMANQLYAAANRAMSVTQAQAQNVAAQQGRRASSGTPKSPVQQSAQPHQQQQQQQSTLAQQPKNPPQPFGVRRLMLENGA